MDMKQESIRMDIWKLPLLFILWIAILVLGGCTNQHSNHHSRAEKGMIDLTPFHFEKDTIQLNGEWEFYSNQLIKSDEIDPNLITGYIFIPSSWNNYKTNEGTISGNGYATYRLTFRAKKNESLALKIPRLHTSYKLWVNGELIAEAGTVGHNRDAAIPQYLPQVAFFETQQENNEILIQVSNFHHRSGGILESIKLGGEKQILMQHYKSIARNIFLFGCLIIMGLYHLALFFFRKKNTPALYFGAFCILVGIRTLLVGECFLIVLFPGFSWEIAHKIMTLTFYLGVPLILMFFLSVFPNYFHSRMIIVAQIIGVLFGVLIFFTPARIFTIVNPFYQMWTMIAILYISIILIKIAIHKEKNSWLIIIGGLAFLLTAINDIVFVSIWMNDEGPLLLRSIFTTGNLSSVGLLIFTLANSLLLAKGFSYSLEKEEMLTVELTEINKNLDKIVLNRTEALVESNEKIEQQKIELEKANLKLQELSTIDSLTQLWNRRKYDEIIHAEWNRCLRHQRPIALILLDIDHFKLYNDYYGHLAGDACLIKIAQTIRNSLLRSTDMAARYGGEEFIVILSDTTKEEAIKNAHMLRQKIEELRIPHQQSPVSKYVTVSIGVTCTIPNMHTSSEDLFEATDKALYQAKDKGRNRVEFK
jgi:diguanylate cyclase (GGDEF)-like protein